MSRSKFKFLVVQGRALKQSEDSMQYFPSSWKDEFPLINKLGFDGIEWIYDKNSEDNNPVINKLGREKMIEVSQQYNVSLENIVFDWFITHPFFDDKFSIEKRIDKLILLIDASAKAGFKRIILPLLEQNRIDSLEKQAKFIDIFKDRILEYLESFQIEIHLETSLPPQKEYEILKKLNHDKVKICFDMGNSASEGYEPISAIKTIRRFLGSVHIKDRKLNGPSTPLNTGCVNFHSVFRTLIDIDFNGPLTFQVYRNKNSDNISLLKESLTFINRVIDDILVNKHA